MHMLKREVKSQIYSKSIAIVFDWYNYKSFWMVSLHWLVMAAGSDSTDVVMINGGGAAIEDI